MSSGAALQEVGSFLPVSLNVLRRSLQEVGRGVMRMAVCADYKIDDRGHLDKQYRQQLFFVQYWRLGRNEVMTGCRSYMPSTHRCTNSNGRAHANVDTQHEIFRNGAKRAVLS